MLPNNAVPDVQLLKRFLLGQLSGAEIEPIERYLEQHPDIAPTLVELVKDDTLLGALRAVAGQAAVDPPELAGLMDKLSALRPVVSGATVDSASGKSAAAAPGDATFAGLAPPQAADEIGRLGGYRVLKVLGAGGMGMVYHAEDVHLQRPIALKVMKPEVAQNPTAKERFLREARAAAKLRSDHVVNIYQVGEDRQVVFLAMEFLEGMSLDDWLKKGRKPTLAQAARIGRQIALGLADAHGCGLIHRDIKPGNIWLDSCHQGRVKLLDFGLARGDNEEAHLTQSGAIVGTPAYMAPEQARGEHVDLRGDLFSLGIVLYRLTTGRLPFRGNSTMSILSSLAMDTPTPPRQVNPDIPPRLAALIERLLSKDREQRPKTAKAVADELAAIEREATQPVAEEGTVHVERVPANRQRQLPGEDRERQPPRGFTRQLTLPVRRWLVAASLLFLLGGAAAAIVVIIRDKDGNKVAEVPVPPGGSVHIDEKDKAKPPAAKESVRIEREPLPELRAGEPLSALALVLQPAKLPGVRSWSLAQRETWLPSAVVYRPDGKQLAVGSWAGTVHIWENKSGRLVRVLFAQGGAVSLAWSPDGRVLAVGSGAFHRCVQLWEADTGRLLRTLATPVAEFIFCLSWSPDGRKLRATGTGQRCYTWEVAHGKLANSPRIIFQCDRPDFSPDGQRLAGTVDGKKMVVWDTDTGKELSRLTAPAAVGRLTWSPDAKRLACTEADGLRVWDVENKKEVWRHAKAINPTDPAAWSPDGRTLTLSLYGNEGTVLLDAATGEELRRLDDGGGSWSAWSPDGKTIVRINGEAWVFLYDSITGERRLTLTDGRTIRGASWSPDHQTLAVSDRFDTFLASADTGQSRVELKQTIWPLAWSADGKRLAAQGPDNVVQVWQAGGQLQFTLTGHKAEVTSLAWSPDGKRLASTAAGEKRVLIWDVVKGERERELGPFAGAAQDVKWSADGRWLTFNVPEVGWHVWNLEKSRLVNDPAKWKVLWFDLMPDGRSALIAPSEKDKYRLRDLASGKDGAQLPFAPSLYLAHPTWPADGRILAVALYDGVELWPADLSKRLRKLPIAVGANRILYSRDGKWMAVQYADRLAVWETDTGRFRGLLMLGRRCNGLTIAPDGHYIGNEKVDSGIVVVVEKDDGTQETLEPAEFKQKYGFKNEPNKVHLLGK